MSYSNCPARAIMPAPAHPELNIGYICSLSRTIRIESYRNGRGPEHCRAAEYHACGERTGENGDGRLIEGLRGLWTLSEPEPAGPDPGPARRPHHPAGLAVGPQPLPRRP